jgi:molybdopterin-guanine dinucleotide biosynthesis protein A
VNSFTISRGGKAQLVATVMGESLIVIAASPEAHILDESWRTTLREYLRKSLELDKSKIRLSPRESDVVYVDISTATRGPNRQYHLDNVQQWIEDAVTRTVYDGYGP